jgi:predicted ATPase
MKIRRYVLTGAPGAGKTTLAGALRLRGHRVVPEAATDVVARFQAGGMDDPEHTGQFIAEILRVQGERAAAVHDPVQIHDRSPVCTVALARWLGHPEPEIDDSWYAREVFLVQPLGFLTRTAVRRISYPDSLRFAQVHADVYRERGFTLIGVPPGPVRERVALIEAALRRGESATRTGWRTPGAFSR